MLERILQLAQDPLASIVFRATWTWGNRPSIVHGIDMSLNLIGCARRVILNCNRPSLASIVFHALWIWGNRQSVDCVWISLAVIVLNEKAVLHHVNRLAMFKALLLGPKSWSTWNCGRKPAVQICLQVQHQRVRGGATLEIREWSKGPGTLRRRSRHGTSSAQRQEWRRRKSKKTFKRLLPPTTLAVL